MKIRAYITTYERKEMLTKTVEHLNSFGIIPQIKDDGSTYKHNLDQYFRHKHRGKKLYWMTWHEMFKDCIDSDAELFIFMPDDFQELEVRKLIALHYQYKREPYVYNIINDGRESEWTGVDPIEVDKNTTKVGFTDCGFFCNREALEALDFNIMPVDPRRWLYYGEGCSSGVGQQLSIRLLEAGVGIYKPVKSLAIHGDHESRMHKEERLKNPLISK